MKEYVLIFAWVITGWFKFDRRLFMLLWRDGYNMARLELVRTRNLFAFGILTRVTGEIDSLCADIILLSATVLEYP